MSSHHAQPHESCLPSESQADTTGEGWPQSATSKKPRRRTTAPCDKGEVNRHWSERGANNVKVVGLVSVWAIQLGVELDDLYEPLPTQNIL